MFLAINSVERNFNYSKTKQSHECANIIVNLLFSFKDNDIPVIDADLIARQGKSSE